MRRAPKGGLSWRGLPRPSTSWRQRTTWMPGTRPGMTTLRYEVSSRPNPIAMKTVRHAMAELHQRDRAGFDVVGVEHCEIAAVFPGAPDHRQQPAVALVSLAAARDEYRLRDGVASRQQVFFEARSLAVDMHDAGQPAGQRQSAIGAGVQAVAALDTAAPLLHALDFARLAIDI